MDSTTSGIFGIMGFLISGGGAIYAAINHKKIRFHCCGKDMNVSVDIDETEVKPKPKKKTSKDQVRVQPEQEESPAEEEEDEDEDEHGEEAAPPTPPIKKHRGDSQV